MDKKHAHVLPIILLPLLMAAGCSKQMHSEPDLPGSDTKSTVLLKMDDACMPIARCITFAFNEDGRAIQKDSVRTLEWKMRCGTYSMRCIANHPSGMAESLWECNDSASLLGTVMSISDINPQYIPALLDIDGENGKVTLRQGEQKELCLKGRSSMARITIHKIENLTSPENVPSIGAVPIRCLKAVLVNVPGAASLDGKAIPPLMNSTDGRCLDLECACVMQGASMSWTEAGKCSDEDICLYSFANGNGTPLILAVAIEIDDGLYWYNIPIGEVEGGFEYIINRLSVMKKGSDTPFDVTPTSSFSVSQMVEPWVDGQEHGLVGIKAGGNLSYELSSNILSLDPPGNCAVLHFGDIHGHARVGSSDTGVISVLGAGKTWSLTAVSEGYSILDINDGVSQASVPLCAGPSIRHIWTNASGKRIEKDDSVFLYQRCTLKTEKWYGNLSIDVDCGGFALEHGSGGIFVLHPVSALLPRGAALSDYFEYSWAEFPGKVIDWKLSECPMSLNENGGNISPNEPIVAVLQFPFDIKREMTEPPEIIVTDKNGNMKKYGITISCSSIGRMLHVKAETRYAGMATKLGITVMCSAGNMSRQLFEIKSCEIRLL